MLKSMTGYGAARRTEGKYLIEAEVRSVNNRFLKVQFRGSDLFQRSQHLFEEIVRAKVSRGTVDLTLRLKLGESEASSQIRRSVLEGYLRQITDIQKDLKLPGSVGLGEILALPGVVENSVEVEDEGLQEQLVQSALKATAAALDALSQMRRTEGQSLEAALLGLIDELESLALQVEKRVPLIVPEYRARLQARVQELLSGTDVKVNENDLLREIAIFAERSDITEELHRLESHVGQFREACRSQESVGRKLEFIAQEMHREANTMGAKANDAALSVLNVDMKGTVDRVKEQVMNVE